MLRNYYICIMKINKFSTKNLLNLRKSIYNPLNSLRLRIAEPTAFNDKPTAFND